MELQVAAVVGPRVQNPDFWRLPLQLQIGFNHGQQDAAERAERMGKGPHLLRRHSGSSRLDRGSDLV